MPNDLYGQDSPTRVQHYGQPEPQRYQNIAEPSPVRHDIPPTRRSTPAPVLGEHSNKFYLRRALFTSLGIVIAWTIAVIVSIVAMIALGLFFRGIANLGNLSTPGYGENCGVNPNTGQIECR